jgi:hypothetical protein
MAEINEMGYVVISEYNGQQVYYDMLENKVYIEKDHSVLVEPSLDERKGLIDSGIVKLINDMLMEVRK